MYFWPLSDPKIAIIVLKLVVVISNMILNIFYGVMLNLGFTLSESPLLEYVRFFFWFLAVDIVTWVNVEVNAV